MFVFLEEFLDVPWHRDVERTSFVVPIQLYSAVKVSCPVLCEAIVRFEACDEVLYMPFSVYFMPKSSTTRVNVNDVVVCRQRPGVFAHS